MSPKIADEDDLRRDGAAQIVGNPALFGKQATMRLRKDRTPAIQSKTSSKVSLGFLSFPMTAQNTPWSEICCHLYMIQTNNLAASTLSFLKQSQTKRKCRKAATAYYLSLWSLDSGTPILSQYHKPAQPPRYYQRISCGFAPRKFTGGAKRDGTIHPRPLFVGLLDSG